MQVFQNLKSFNFQFEEIIFKFTVQINYKHHN